MRKWLLSIVVIGLFASSCIPLRIAPKIEDDKVVQGKRFKRGLPKREMFIFRDPKDSNEFYHYVNTKYALNHVDVYDDIPFKLAEQQFFFSFYEVEIPTKTINLLPIVVDGLLESGNMDPMMGDIYFSRKGNWYIAIEVYSDIEPDCLKENALSREVVLEYLRALRKEYLSTHNYNEVVFKH